MLIYQSKNFIVEAPEHPHVDRTDGGHIRIKPIKKVLDRQALSRDQAIELMDLTRVVGAAMIKVMNAHGVDIGRINYQDNGNWSVFKPEGPYLHMHIYGRAKSAKIQKYGEALYFPHKKEDPDFYKDNQPLTKEDVESIKKEIEKNFTF